MITKETKTAVIAENKTHETDTGSPEVQIAILTQRIRELTAHLKVHPNDDHSRAAVCSTTSPRRTSSAIVQSLQSWASVSKSGISEGYEGFKQGTSEYCPLLF